MPPTSRPAAGEFFRRYARTWYHGVAVAGMTAFGTLTVVDDRFAIVALLAYALPPIVLFARAPERVGENGAEATPDERAGDDRAADGHDTSATDAGEADPDPAVDSEPDAVGPPSESEPDDAPPAWSTATVPTDERLTDAAVAGDRAYAVGAAGTLLQHDGDDWAVAVADGPDAESTTLTGVAATSDGVWVAGDSGTVGRFDPESARHVSHSAPDGDTTNLVDVAAAGGTGDETVLLADGSGRLRRGRYRDGEVAWDEPVTPASGSSLSGVVLATPTDGYACDTNQTVVRTTDGGRSFRSMDVDAAGTLTDVASADPDRCLVADDSGVVHRYDGGYWTPERVSDGPVHAVAVRDDRAVACGSSGTVFESDGSDWTRLATPASGDLHGVAVGGDRAIAVGDDGTVLQRAGE